MIWPTNLSKPVDPLETTLRYQAMSILHGFVADPLPETADQAKDIINWSKQRFKTPQVRRCDSPGHADGLSVHQH